MILKDSAGDGGYSDYAKGKGTGTGVERTGNNIFGKGTGDGDISDIPGAGTAVVGATVKRQRRFRYKHYR